MPSDRTAHHAGALAGRPVGGGAYRRWRALALIAAALALCGCAAVSGSDPHARTPGVLLDDRIVERMALRRIDAADELLRKGNVDVVCFNGIVLLTGQVENDSLRAKAEAALADIRKIRKIHNEIQVGGPTSYVARSNDAWITTKVRTAILAAGVGGDIGVTTEDGVIFLLGLVRREDADAAVAATQEVFGVRKIVKVFEYVN